MQGTHLAGHWPGKNHEGGQFRPSVPSLVIQRTPPVPLNSPPPEHATVYRTPRGTCHQMNPPPPEGGPCARSPT